MEKKKPAIGVCGGGVCGGGERGNGYAARHESPERVRRRRLKFACAYTISYVFVRARAESISARLGRTDPIYIIIYYNRARRDLFLFVIIIIYIVKHFFFFKCRFTLHPHTTAITRPAHSLVTPTAYISLVRKDRRS